jgi:hypothetical protein
VIAVGAVVNERSIVATGHRSATMASNTTYFVAGFIPEGVLVEVELDAIVP